MRGATIPESYITYASLAAELQQTDTYVLLQYSLTTVQSTSLLYWTKENVNLTEKIAEAAGLLLLTSKM
jgi:hypothetical protein